VKLKTAGLSPAASNTDRMKFKNGLLQGTAINANLMGGDTVIFIIQEKETDFNRGSTGFFRQ
jgi:hypothetical protein